MNRRRKNDDQKQPVHSIELPVQGGRIDLGIWENTVGEDKDERTVYAVSISRSYHDGKEWQSTKSMRTQDLPALQHGLGKAYDWILEESSQ
ncbi:hypothetical protein Pan258_01680 [Symmachiella dynata]|uniref:hypothetical protein n=1 Tax=Symmachiella dynata TaxID=2527995 RepID=UPI001187FE38|nr:hypothetical protein [Symmachiella dynata]QDT46151.1 hypothetical protein Pan258_01680 [Symmachiella dynata]